MTKMLQSIGQLIGQTGASLKSIAKVMLSPRHGRAIERIRRERPLVVLGNGPSLNDSIPTLLSGKVDADLMAVNFAANTPEFAALNPQWYVMADPHFADMADPNVARLWQNLRDARIRPTLLLPGSLKVSTEGMEAMRFPAVGVEGLPWLCRALIDRRLGMPRPRNVLICAIMCGIWAGYTTIYIVGADHSWTRTLSVDEHNRVVSIQPHYYSENDNERERVAAVYENVKLHEILDSFRIAFKAYHDIARYAAARGVTIVNATPGSYIDAFARGPLPLK